MAATQLTTSGHQVSKTLKRISWSFKAPDSEEDQENINLEDDEDDILCVSGSRLIRTGLRNTDCEDNVVMFVNAGGGAPNEGDSRLHLKSDMFFQGGDVLRTDETIICGGDYPSIYQSARFGSFWYRFDHLRPGDYFVDLHFVEIINTSGPKGMRVFDVFMQEEKVLSGLDIYSIVGANRPLQLIDVRVHVGADGEILIRFKGIHGSPIVSGICIKEAPKLLASQVENGHLICNNCAAEIELSSAQDKLMRMKSTAKYEKKIEDLSTQCQLKSDECYEAWMSLAAANEQLEKLRMELDKHYFQNRCLDQTMVKQAAELKDVSSRYEGDKKFWVAAINELERKIKIMNQEHTQLSREAHHCADSVPELNMMVAAVQALVAQYDDLKLKYSEEQAKRKKLYNQVQEAKGNIRVFCRCRPLSKLEVSAGYATVVDFDAAKDGELGIITGGSTKKIFKFDRVYTPKDDQVDIFVDASPMVNSVLDGYNVCIFAYGQTGTGKTFTMEGSEQNRGVNYRTLEQLFKVVEERKETFAYNISVSVLEVYNEQIRDLLATSPTSKKLEIKQASEGVHHVPGIVEARVEKIKQVWDVLQAGSNARVVGSNNVNEHSSRSHCMLCIMVRAKNMITGECTKSKLWLVDLAGSERLAKTDVQGERLKEAQNINRSLSSLGDVISALATKSSHIPYRNSKLTHLLQDSLGGDSKTVMFVQISPSEQDLPETLSSLNFASRVRGVELGPAKKQIDTSELQKLKAMLDKAKQESRFKDDALRKLEENIQNLEAKAKARDEFCRNQQGKVDELKDQLESKTVLCRELEKQLSEGVKGKEEICSTLRIKVKDLENKLNDCKPVKDLENKLKERTQEFEFHSASLQQKIKELEEKLRQQERQSKCMPPSLCSFENLVATPNERKDRSRTETIYCDTDAPSLRSLKSCNRRMSQESVSLKGKVESLRKKREVQSKGNENNFLLSASLLDKKTLPAQSNKAKHNDAYKSFAKLTRTANPLTSGQRPLSNNRGNREDVTAAKERENRSRAWLR